MFKPSVPRNGMASPANPVFTQERLAMSTPMQWLKTLLLGRGKMVNRPPRTFDLEPMLRREVDLPRQPALIAMNTGSVFTVTADLQEFDIDSLRMEIDLRQFTLSGWVTQKNQDESSTDCRTQNGAFKSSRIIPPSMDLDNFTIHFSNGVLTLSVPKKQRMTARTSG